MSLVTFAFIQVFRESRNSPYLYDYLFGFGGGALPFTQSQSSSVIGIQLSIIVLYTESG